MQSECSEREARIGWLMRQVGRSAGVPCARDKPAGAFVVSGKILVGCWTDARMSDGLRRDRQMGKINTNTGKSSPVSQPRLTTCYKVDIRFTHIVNQRSSTRPNLFELKSHLVLAITYKMLAL